MKYLINGNNKRCPGCGFYLNNPNRIRCEVCSKEHTLKRNRARKRAKAIGLILSALLNRGTF